MSLILNNLKEVDFTVITVHDDGSKTWSVPHAQPETALEYKKQLKQSLFSEMHLGGGQQNRVRDIFVVERTTAISERIVG